MRINTGIVTWLAFVIILTLVGGIVLSNYATESYKNVVYKRVIDEKVKRVDIEANEILKDEDFIPNNLDKKEKTFSQFLHQINNGEIVGITVWSTDKTVIYSDDKEIIGKTFNDDNAVGTALSGDIISRFSNSNLSENISEESVNNLLKIYIPIKSDSNTVMGVVETHVSLDSVDSYHANENKIINLIVYSVIALSCIGIFLTYYAFRENLIKPIKQIHEYTKKIGSGVLEIESKPKGFDELQNLANEMKIMTTLLKDQQEKIVKSERLSAIGELAARLAHDLRNPLIVIRMALFVIQNKYGEDSEINQDVKRINLAMQRMSSQIESVMNFVATKPLKIEKNSISRIIKSVIKNTDIPDSIKINLPTNDVTLDCDSDQLEVVFENLFQNARQAMKDVGTLNIRIIEDYDRIKIEVEDSGPGIPDEILPRIFDPLFTTKQEGTGLGLPSCKNIIEQHKGTINVKTEVGKGTTFTIELLIDNKSQNPNNFPTLSQITNT
ncbi:MAG TPA: HAMP domain-containing sensor histidine kinase [Nitrosopumilaceae archaeon]|nr:HAMP domain-containing sensor histidine kinase [Nitrosopumilaceae archaeon]